MIRPYNRYTPLILPLNDPTYYYYYSYDYQHYFSPTIIAPYWSNVDLTGTGNIFYRQTKNPDLLARASIEISNAFLSSQNVTVTNLFIVTWDAVGYYYNHADKVS